ncbi:MAG: hypothetical protein HYS38_09815 [Acidobacteria bacterium]|nr:hypothetical protein [Acidobacteriota bacterium]
MELSRYAFADAYILEELKRKYFSAGPQRRIDLLQTLYASVGSLPYEIAVLAVEDPNAEVRQWIAQNGKHLDYSDKDANDDRNLEGRLRNDPDVLVRACFLENPEAYDLLPSHARYGIEETFRGCAHLERLALMRNPKICFARELVERLFDPDDHELGLQPGERAELVRALLTNREYVQESHQVSPRYHMEGLGWHFTNEHFSKVWKLAPKWQLPGTGIPYCIYRYLGGPAVAKSDVYRDESSTLLRAEILSNCDPLEDAKVIELGLKDSDDSCRELAFSMVSLKLKDAVIRAIQTADSAAFLGLRENPHLSEEAKEFLRKELTEKEKQQVEHKLSELGVVDNAWPKPGSIEQRTDELFDTGTDKKIPIEQKVNFIGKRFLSLEKELRERLREIAMNPPLLERTLPSYPAILYGGVIALLFLLAAERWGGWGILGVVILVVLAEWHEGRYRRQLAELASKTEERRAQKYNYEYED